ncbi:MAG: crossover junction endodeoxyribonuclease RuvC [Candidatus Brocadiaceae bacterium]|nr:crossover junction endodeoxyribonuclease RuvC [Candidatus Brocadiaceae bacterium]
MRILGIDPGTRVCGYAVIEVNGPDARAVDYGVVRAGGDSLARRLQAVHDGLRTIIDRFGPGVAALEGAFFGKNALSALKIGEGRGVALLAAAEGGLEVIEYAPAEVKKAVTGNGRAQKGQVQQMVRVLLNLPEIPQPEDAADALAIALCHFHRLPR